VCNSPLGHKNTHCIPDFAGTQTPWAVTQTLGGVSEVQSDTAPHHSATVTYITDLPCGSRALRSRAGVS
jgi:hypothetical protein